MEMVKGICGRTREVDKEERISNGEEEMVGEIEGVIRDSELAIVQMETSFHPR